jgi:hypothetical protein
MRSHIQPVRLAGGWWLVLICSERKVLLAGCWWLIILREKYYWLVADKPNEQGDCWCDQCSTSSSQSHRCDQPYCSIHSWNDLAIMVDSSTFRVTSCSTVPASTQLPGHSTPWPRPLCHSISSRFVWQGRTASSTEPSRISLLVLVGRVVVSHWAHQPSR